MDFINQINQAVELVSAGVKATDLAAEGAVKIKSLFGLAKTSRERELEALVADLGDEVVNAKIANGNLKLLLLKMLETAQGMQKQREQFERYELWTTPAGYLVYRLKDTDDQGDPLHYLCPKCADQAQKVILQGPSDNLSKQ